MKQWAATFGSIRENHRSDGYWHVRVGGQHDLIAAPSDSDDVRLAGHIYCLVGQCIC